MLHQMKKLLLTALAITILPTIALAFEPVFLSEESFDSPVYFDSSVQVCVEDTAGNATMFYLLGTDLQMVTYPEGTCEEAMSVSTDD